MSGPSHDRIGELFNLARSLSSGDRQRLLDERCAGDAELRAEVEALLDADAAATAALDTAVVARSLGRAAVNTVATDLPDRIGPYRIIRLIGEGGMGAVYEAEQDDPRRRVALKVIRQAMLTRRMLRRFRHETQVLGQLRHPGIAQIYEADTADRQPYFAMELVHGRPLIEYAGAAGLGIRQRLALIADVCDALHHAHQKGVIHRDLKPANILVEESGRPRILDFGVARLTDADVQTVTLQTGMGELVGTVPYMSPEQASGDPNALDIRSDIYALGVVTYELLTGDLPYPIRSSPVYEAVRIIREREPSRLSSSSRIFRGDVETIIGKTLEKDRDRRYESAAALAADIRRYLRDEPIVARPASAIYQLSKFARRHKALVGGTAGIFVVLVVALVVITAALARAGRQARIAEAVNDFLNRDLLAAPDPRNQVDRDVTMREVLDLAGDRIEGRFDGEPAVEAAIRLTLGETYMNLGEYAKAVPHLQRGLDLRRAGGAGPGDLFDAVSLAGKAYTDLDRPDEAEPLLDEALAIASDAFGPDDERTIAALVDLASLHYKQGEVERAEPLFIEAVERGSRIHPGTEDTLSAIASLAMLLQRTKRYAEAEPLSVEAVEGYRMLLGATHPYTLTAQNNLAMLYSDTGRFEQAEPLFQDVLATRLRTLGVEHSDTLVSKATLARAYLRERRFVEAEPLALAAYEGLLATLGRGHQYTRIAADLVASIYEGAGRVDDAERWRREFEAVTPQP